MAGSFLVLNALGETMTSFGKHLPPAGEGTPDATRYAAGQPDAL